MNQEIAQLVLDCPLRELGRGKSRGGSTNIGSCLLNKGKGRLSAGDIV